MLATSGCLCSWDDAIRLSAAKRPLLAETGNVRGRGGGRIADGDVIGQNRGAHLPQPRAQLNFGTWSFGKELARGGVSAPVWMTVGDTRDLAELGEDLTGPTR